MNPKSYALVGIFAESIGEVPSGLEAKAETLDRIMLDTGLACLSAFERRQHETPGS
ncbi:hypothetical protein [Streptomyces sp. C10]|uniref:hypothetical protein n=1 Tax=Streptomyces sp. C10 TaxID=531941 RepID=UPI00397F5CD1